MPPSDATTNAPGTTSGAALVPQRELRLKQPPPQHQETKFVPGRPQRLACVQVTQRGMPPEMAPPQASLKRRHESRPRHEVQLEQVQHQCAPYSTDDLPFSRACCTTNRRTFSAGSSSSNRVAQSVRGLETQFLRATHL